MGTLRSGSHSKAPLQMLIFGLVLIGAQAYRTAGPDAVDYAVRGSLEKLLIQVPAGIVAVLIASRLISFDFGTIWTVALKLAAINILAEGVGCWFSPEFPFNYLGIAAELSVILVGFFWLFELSKWETYLVVLLNFAMLFAAHYVMANYVDSHRSFWAKPEARAQRGAARSPARRASPNR